ncbi:hypothetical protein HMPREF9381_0681 [Streptococcus sanguinis SK72]|uniref:Uncharacterized protein n=1 Tax=Streptococcus sanguinis SK72 TaxID=888809 RepID=F0I0J1_STRSA|nr:hypothetical protein HMPREF9381_0681 [Streptococcus sanguinis SK72]
MAQPVPQVKRLVFGNVELQIQPRLPLQFQVILLHIVVRSLNFILKSQMIAVKLKI